MTIRSLALAPALLIGLAVQAMAAPIPLSDISRYLDGLTTVTSDFTQVNPDGTVSTGTVYIQRPGRVRFEYDNDNTLVLASGGNVAIFDSKSNGGPQQYPLSQTPLSIILDSNVNLNRQGVVIGHTEQENGTIVVAQDPQHPDHGNIQMVFTSPTELRQWVVTDDSGQKTTVILGEMQKGGSIPSSLFSIQAAMGGG